MWGVARGCRRTLSRGRGGRGSPRDTPVPSRARAHDSSLIQNLSLAMTMLPSLKRDYYLQRKRSAQRAFPSHLEAPSKASPRTAARSEGTPGDLGTLVEAVLGPEGSRLLRRSPAPATTRPGRGGPVLPGPGWPLAAGMCPSLSEVCLPGRMGHLLGSPYILPRLTGLPKPQVHRAALGLEGAPGTHSCSLNNQLSLHPALPE